MIITSPGYPNTEYPAYQDCTRVVRFQEVTPFRIEFLGDFDTVSCDSGSAFIEIKNGEDNDAPLIMKACGRKKPLTTTSIGNYVWIRFKSNYGSGKGFSLDISKLARSDGNF